MHNHDIFQGQLGSFIKYAQIICHTAGVVKRRVYLGLKRHAHSLSIAKSVTYQQSIQRNKKDFIKSE